MKTYIDLNNLIAKAIMDYQLLSRKELKNSDICFDPISFIIESGLNTVVNINDFTDDEDDISTRIYNPRVIEDRLADLFFDNYFNYIEDRYIEAHYPNGDYDTITEQEMKSDNSICPTEDGLRFVQILFSELAHYLVSNFQILNVNNITIAQVYPNNNLPFNVNQELYNNIFFINFNV